MGRTSETKRKRKELVATYLRSNPPEGYDAMSKRVNASYSRTGDIGVTMKEIGLPFDLVWEMIGFKDQFDFVEMGED